MQKFCRSRTGLTKNRKQTTDLTSKLLIYHRTYEEHLKKLSVSIMVRERSEVTITLNGLAQKARESLLVQVQSCRTNFRVAASIARV